MADMKSVYLTAHGSYPTGSWMGEAAQIGVRVVFVPTIGAPDKGAIFEPALGGEIVADFGTEAGAHGILSKTWSARIGVPSSAQNMDAARQIDMAEDVWTFLNTIKAYQYSAFKWTHVKCSAVTAAGTTPVVSSVYTFGTAAGGGGATGLPPQVAMALSTRANLVGRRGRGRVYIPALTSSILAADGTISATPANSLRAAFKQLIDDLQASPGLSTYLPIVTVQSAASDTSVRPVEVRTGSRLDTIQSRRRQVEEVYTSTAL